MNENYIIKENKYNITTDKNNIMELYLRYYENDEISISIYSINKIPSVKYELKSNLDEFQKNRFFKIFNNVEELMLELDSKIKNTTFLEETNLIILDIPIGLKIINDILLEIKIVEKTPFEKIEELKENNNKLKLDIENLKNIIIEKDNKINQILNQNNELNEENKKLKNEINNNNDCIKDLKLNIENLQKQIKNYEIQLFFLNEEDMEQIYNELNDDFNIQKEIDLDSFKIKLKDLIKQEKEKKCDKEKIMSDLKEKMTDLIDLFLNEKEMEQIYNDLKEEMNIENVINLENFKIKLKDLIKQEKENYKKWDKEEILSDLKEKMTDLIL